MRIVTMQSQPMLYIVTRTSERSSAIASTIKTSLDQVLRFMDEQGIRPAGNPIAVFSDWNGRLVTIEAGYPVSQDSLTLAAGRIQAGRTPEGSAALWKYEGIDQANRRNEFGEEAMAAGLRLTGTTWEVYNRSAADAGTTEFYAQLFGARISATPFGG